MPAERVPDHLHAMALGECDDLVGRDEVELARLRLEAPGLEFVLGGEAVELPRDQRRKLRVVESPGHDRRTDEEAFLHGVSQRPGRSVGWHRVACHGGLRAGRVLHGHPAEGRPARPAGRHSGDREERERQGRKPARA